MYKIYEIDENDHVRYALGNKKGKTLYVIGVNPSTATDIQLDPTVTNVKNFAYNAKFDSFLMFNLYPQRATDPKDLDTELNQEIHKTNVDMIKYYLESEANIWAAWGMTIEKRNYLTKCLMDINQAIKDLNPHWLQYEKETKAGHPKHPSRKSKEGRFNSFDMDQYIELLSGKKKAA